jgi:hypothetical protein
LTPDEATNVRSIAFHIVLDEWRLARVEMRADQTRAARIVVTVWLCAVASPAFTQVATSPALFLETVRDPGGADLPSTARSLALGGIRFGSGRADEALASPASLVLGAGSDVIVSGGPFFYARDELVNTPGQFPPRDPARRRSPSSPTLPAFAAFATRHRAWAVAGFYDGSSRFGHRFDTATSNIYFAALQGTFLSEDGTGHASVLQQVSRIGGAAAIGPPSHRAALGIGVSAVRLDYDVAAHVHVDGQSSVFGGPIARFTAEHDNRVSFLGWGPAFVIGGMARPITNVIVAGRWERNPEFSATRRIVIEERGQTVRDDNPVRFQPPSTYAIGVSVTARRTVIAGDIARTRFSQAFQPILRTAGSDRCAIPQLYCPGWGIANYEAVDATTWRAAIEQAIPTTRGAFIVRGGTSFQAGYTVGRKTSDPFRNGGSSPAPPFLSDYEPPREHSTWVTGGVAYAWQRYEVAFGAGRSQTQTRLLADFCVRIP